jgi:hypothetical protein
MPDSAPQDGGVEVPFRPAWLEAKETIAIGHIEDFWSVQAQFELPGRA